MCAKVGQKRGEFAPFKYAYGSNMHKCIISNITNHITTVQRLLSLLAGACKDIPREVRSSYDKS